MKVLEPPLLVGAPCIPAPCTHELLAEWRDTVVVVVVEYNSTDSDASCAPMGY